MFVVVVGLEASEAISLRSAVGERKQWSGGGETAGTDRNAAAEPQTEARTFCSFQMSTNGQAGCDVGRSGISEGSPACWFG
jgi:hypothetical protein